MPQSQEPATVFVDADNTLWDTDAVFAAAQMRLLADVQAALDTRDSLVDPLSFIREVDQAIAERHHDGLRYPPLLLVRSAEKALRGMSADEAARAASRGRHDYGISDEQAKLIVASFLASLSVLPTLRVGVLEGLEALHRTGCVLLVVSESSKAKVERTCEGLGILSFFERVIEGRKRPTLYRRVLALTGFPTRAFMIGDQLDRDILPAKVAGLETIYFPGGFRPRWAMDAVNAADHLIESFAQVVGLIAPTDSTAEPQVQLVW